MERSFALIPFLSNCSNKDKINCDFSITGSPPSPYPSTISIALMWSLLPAAIRTTSPPIASTNDAYSRSGSQIRISSCVASARNTICIFALKDFPLPGTPKRNEFGFRSFSLLHMIKLWEIAFSPQ